MYRITEERPAFDKIRSSYDLIHGTEYKEDRYHRRATRIIQRFLTSQLKPKISHSSRILNAGSGLFTYSLDPNTTISLDASLVAARKLRKSIVANLENLPFEHTSIDAVVCVGSVLNYLDAQKGMRQVAGILPAGGFAVLEYEKSTNISLLGTPGFGSAVLPVEVNYHGDIQAIWLYSDEYINNLMRHEGLTLICSVSFNLFSPLIYKWSGSYAIAGLTSLFEPAITSSSRLAKISANTILLATKT